MAEDPGFVFYPGDYLRDTQCLSEKVQVAYDRIMCEHMRNICISQQQLKFFTKRFTDDEISELMMVLTETSDGFQIKWVAESIIKRREYSESRRKNRQSTPKKTSSKDKNISSSYDKHMDNEDEIVNEDEKESIKEGVQGKPSAPEGLKTQIHAALMEEFGFTFQNDDKRRWIYQFLTHVEETKGLLYFQATYIAYKQYKDLSGERRHNFTGLIGSPANGFENGGWDSDNWAKKIIDYNAKQSKSTTTEDRKQSRDRLGAQADAVLAEFLTRDSH